MSDEKYGLEIVNLKKSYGATPVLLDISISIGPGEFVSLLGASGSGKTTLLRCIAGLERPDSGIIRLGSDLYSDENHFERPEARGLGMVFQNYAVWPHLSVFENVAFPFRIRSRWASRNTERDIGAKVHRALDLVRMTALAGRLPHELSGGQQQRVALARALAMSPKALLLDEPLSNLDAVLREELGAEIRRLQQEFRLTTILVTHDRREALSLSDRIVVIEKGHVEAEGLPEVLYRHPPTPFVASFISGAQTVKREGREEVFLPRGWKVQMGAPAFEIRSRLFLGQEYEYLASRPEYGEKIRFFSPERFEVHEKVPLNYQVSGK